MSDEQPVAEGEAEATEEEVELPEGAAEPLATDPILGDQVHVPTIGGEMLQDPQPESQPRPESTDEAIAEAQAKADQEAEQADQEAQA